MFQNQSFRQAEPFRASRIGLAGTAIVAACLSVVIVLSALAATHVGPFTPTTAVGAPQAGARQGEGTGAAATVAPRFMPALQHKLVVDNLIRPNPLRWYVK